MGRHNTYLFLGRRRCVFRVDADAPQVVRLVAPVAKHVPGIRDVEVVEVTRPEFAPHFHAHFPRFPRVRVEPVSRVEDKPPDVLMRITESVSRDRDLYE